MSNYRARINEHRAKFGTAATLKWIAARIAYRLFHIEVVEVIWLDRDSLSTDEPSQDQGLEFRFLEINEIMQFAQDPLNEIGADFIHRASSSNDLCFAVLDGNQLASYGWYALQSIEAEHNFGTALSFPAHVAYMYKGFTKPEYRGRRLHGIGMGLALSRLESHGVTALVSTVEFTNWASLKSCLRLGYQRLGKLWKFGPSPNVMYLAPPAARNYGIHFGNQATVSPRLTEVL